MDDSAAHGAVPMTPVAAVNTDIVKALRQTGFPDVESKATPSSLATKVIATIQKRLNKLEEMAGKITDVAAPSRTDLMNKTLGSNFIGQRLLSTPSTLSFGWSMCSNQSPDLMGYKDAGKDRQHQESLEQPAGHPERSLQ